MIAATCYGLPVHKSLKPTASRISEITPKAVISTLLLDHLLTHSREGTVRR
jgi:hypothetical protein